jgi:hypothetical protein
MVSPGRDLGRFGKALGTQVGSTKSNPESGEIREHYEHIND